MAYRVCANLEEAETAQANGLLWLRLGGDMWVAALRHDYGPVRFYYGTFAWPKKSDFAVLVEDEDSE